MSMPAGIRLDRQQAGIYRVFDASRGCLGTITGARRAWQAQPLGGRACSNHQTRAEAAKALISHPNSSATPSAR